MPKGPKYLKKVKTTTRLVSVVVERLTNAILDGELKPGERIPTELELSSSLGIGRNSVREAIKVLEFMGILEIRHAGGTFVTSSFNMRVFNPVLYGIIMRSGNVDEIFQFRRLFDVGTMLLALSTATAEDIENTNRAYEAYAAAMRSGTREYDKLIELDMAFHHSFALATKNELVIAVGQLVAQITRVSRVESLRSLVENGKVEESLAVHKKLVAVLETRDTQSITEAVAQCCSNWREMLNS